ncbi:MAG: leucine--tRNA ligase [Planctomycetes bacterium]|nr:leucine--tRNA ligase [Planctomycetota bacterium]
METKDFNSIESKWQANWAKNGLFNTPASPKKKFYLLEMFAYPSGDIHIGHFRNYTIGDVFWRYLKMKGFDILHPFGWDAFGLPAEEAAIKRKLHPGDWTMNNIKTSRETLKQLAISYDWDREVITCTPEYYKWTQWVFLTLYKMGLAYRAGSSVNWCPSCKTVLANEQVEGGICWRCKSEVTKRKLEQWFFKITDYAERLLNDIDKLNGWPENIKIMQKNWIGKSEGTEIKFQIPNPKLQVSVFTTRPDTIYGVTFMVMAPEHPLVKELTTHEHKKEVEEYIRKAALKSEMDRTTTGEKDGVFTGSYAINPLSGEKVQLWVADYVLLHYGTGIVMGVPAHDQRDFLFAKKYNIPMKVVINPKDKSLSTETMTEAYNDPGTMVNSGPFNGINSVEGIKKITEYVKEKGLGKATTHYRLKDWLLSRQRYWGAPIPMIHCPKCGVVPVDEKDLPVLLPPDVKDFIPKGRSPLSDVPSFMNTTCPKCKGHAQRDPDTMDTFVCSSWYHLRYSDPKNSNAPFGKDKVKEWLPVDLYIGGAEHACGHLIYFRFITKVLHDAGWLTFDEPAKRLFNHGMVLDANGEVMSKSKGNVVSPRQLMEEWGIDVSRFAMLFFAPSDWEIKWHEKGLIGAKRFLVRVWNLINASIESRQDGTNSKEETANNNLIALKRKLHQTIKRVTEDIDPKLEFNTAISAIMELVNELYAQIPNPNSPIPNHGVIKEAIKTVVVLLAPFVPHLSEEMWQKLGEKNSIFTQPWPLYDADMLVAEKIELVIQVNGKVKSKIIVSTNAAEDEIKTKALEDDKIKELLDGKTPRKMIIVPKRLVNIVP